MKNKFYHLIGNFLTFFGLMSVDLIGINLINLGAGPYDYIIIPLSIISSIWIVVLVSEYLGIFTMKDVSINWQDIKRTLKWFLLSILATSLGAIILYFEGGNTTNNQVSLTESFSSVSVFTIFLLIAIAAPVMEELIIRGFLIKKCFNFSKVGVLVSSIIFGMLHHPTSLGEFTTYFGMGLVLGIYYKKTERIELVILLHGIHNFIGAFAFVF